VLDSSGLELNLVAFSRPESTSRKAATNVRFAPRAANSNENACYLDKHRLHKKRDFCGERSTRRSGRPARARTVFQAKSSRSVGSYTQGMILGLGDGEGEDHVDDT
jgi:hypothetical protein